MKKRILFISALFTGILLASCATKPADESTGKSHQKKEIPVVEIVEPEPSPEEIFLSGLQDIKIQFTNIPSKTKKGKAFSTAYEVLVTDSQDQAISDFNLTFKVPVKKDENLIVFSEIDLITDENGKASYMPEKPLFAAKTSVFVYPGVPEGLNIAKTSLQTYEVSADFLSESDIANKGAILFVFEYNENGKSPKNSYDILSGLRKKGVSMIGNAPISDTEYITASKTKIYKDNYAYVGNDFGYLIGGTVKYVNPVEKNEDGTYTAHMIAEIYGIEMKTGNVIFEEIKENTGSGANWSKAVDSCKTKLTADIVDALMFGL